MSLTHAAWTPTSTYRLQLGPSVTFAHAEALVPYLASLGVGALYLSPMLEARPGSTHGYDICKHGALNPDLGTDDDLVRLASTAHRHGLRLLADIVPNHVGVDPQANPWWREVLENGPCSMYAGYFDIDWEPITPHLHQKVLLPILGNQYGAVLERGELQVAFDDGRLLLRYVDTVLPINPRQAPIALRHAEPHLRATFGDAHPAVLEFLSIIEGLSNLPPYTDTQSDRIATRAREKEVLRGRLARLVADTPVVLDAIEGALRHVNGRPGHPESFDDLHMLLEAQPYRLASWRTAVDEINYRRFFDVNDLAAVCVEHDDVFDATHVLVERWLREGIVHGLRVDHPDGLLDPPAYFERLQALARIATARTAPIYTVAEKILSNGERLRPDWEVHGTTGYAFLSDVNGLFLDPAGMRQLQRLHARVTGLRDPLHEIVYESKKLIMNTTMSSELGVLTDALARIARSDRRTRDFTQNSLRELLIEYVACIPVYRTYVGPRGWTPEDGIIIDRTIAEARRRNPATERSLFTFLRAVLLSEREETADGSDNDGMHERRLAFAMKLQQYTGPVQAKGVEDTAFYRHNVLVSTTEVGGEPARAARDVEEFHTRMASRVADTPLTMTTLTTHDTKLGEDVRARLNVLSELPDPWRETLGRVLRATSHLRVRLADTWAPDRSDEYRCLQILVGCWPPDVPVAAPAPEALVERLQTYMTKAIREAKRHTSWLTPNEAYETGMLAYVEGLLRGPGSKRALAALRPLMTRVMRHGVSNALAQTAIKLTAPGMPDTYQGTEEWALHLVDPDNRGPVDFDGLATRLAHVTAAQQASTFGPDRLAAWLDTWQDGDIKRHVVSTLLRARRADPELWLQGGYQPLLAETSVDATAMAYARVASADRWAIVIAGTRTARLHGDWPVGAAWATSRVVLSPSAPSGAWRDLLTGTEHRPVESATERWLFLAQTLQSVPVSVLVPLARPPACTHAHSLSSQRR